MMLRLGSLSLLLTFALGFGGCATAPSAAQKSRTFAASQALKVADRQFKISKQSTGLYLSAAQAALDLAQNPSASPAERAQGLSIYNAAVTGCVLALQWQNSGPLNSEIHPVVQVPGATYDLSLVSTGEPGLKNPAAFDRFQAANKVAPKRLQPENVRPGLGATLVGRMNSSRTKVPNRLPAGFAEPITAIASFGPKTAAGATPVRLSFLDPLQRKTVKVDGATYPLAANFTAPLLVFPTPNEMIFGIVAMLRSDRSVSKSGIYFLEPYDPKKIPVLFVHGLMSSPLAWVAFINELNRDPAFRERYQPWVYFYPTGSPIAANAMRLRRDLAQLEKDYPLTHKIVVVGHSMGGILTQMQITNSKRILWDEVFGQRADALYAKFDDKSMLKRALVFQANPHISRVIFVATPHLGSNLANLRIASLAARFIRLPLDVIHGVDQRTRAAIMGINPVMRTIPTSIQGLSPKSQLLLGVAKLPITIPYNSIIGNQGKDNIPLAQSSDGVVPYWSSHMAGAQSEIIVPTGHDAFNSPKSVKEVLRILALQN